jgi:hypothetical protein
MLTTDKLAAVGVDASSNATVQHLWRAVQRYNLLSRAVAGNAGERAGALQDVMRWAGLYITSKPPASGKQRMIARWQALVALAEEASLEAASLGVKMVRGPSDMMQLAPDPPVRKNDAWAKANASMWLEVIDPLHRHGFDLSILFEDWGTDPLAIAGKTSFWDYARTHLDKDSVSYLDGSAHGVHFKGRRLVENDDEDALADTSGMETAFSGGGWGIFVCSVDWDLYLHSHVAGTFHHTTFLGGKPVRAAGEMRVDQGLIRELTAKTGHYWTTPELLLEFVKHFWEIPDDARVRPDMGDKARTGHEVFYRCGDFRKNGSAATPLPTAAAPPLKKGYEASSL